MANVSISDIATQWKVSRPTIQKRLKSGKLSGSKDDQGKWQIDVSEVIRCFGEPIGVISPDTETVTTPLQAELTDALRDQIAMLKDQLEKTNELNKDLVGQLAAQTKMIEYAQPKSLFNLFRKKAA